MKHWEAEYPHVEDGSDVLGEAMSVVRNQNLEFASLCLLLSIMQSLSLPTCGPFSAT